MTPPKTYPHGVPSWVDTVAHDLDEAKRFYAGLFDWTFTDAVPADAPGSYLVAAIGGQDVAAIASAESDDEPITWRTYIAVDDADATANAEIRSRPTDAPAPPGFEDAVGWMGIIPLGHPELWQVSFNVSDRDAAAATAEGLDGTIVDTEDAEWTKTATVRDPQGAQFVL